MLKIGEFSKLSHITVKAYAYLLNYAKENGVACAGTIRECYIDGIWNKKSPDDWLTEVQMPIE